MDPMLTVLSGHPLLQGMRTEHLQRLADCAMETRYAQGEVIFREGEPANRFYLIQEGLVAVETVVDGEPVRVQTVGPGEVLGWSWLFPPYYWHFDARAIEPARAIFFYGSRLREECEEDRDLGFELMKRMAGVMIKRLQSTRRQLLDLRRNTL